MKTRNLLIILVATGCGGNDADTPAEPNPDQAPAPYDLAGPDHPVGVLTLDLLDESREGGRRLPTEVWYPAGRRGSLEETTVLGAPVAYRDVTPLAEGAPFPVIVFSHGDRGVAFQSTFLTIGLASRGYIVVAVTHTGNTTLNNSGKPEAKTNRPLDVSFALTEVLAGGGGRLDGLTDPDRVGLSGHSFGAWTTLVAMARDDRFIAAFPISPGGSETPGVTKELAIPTMIIIGTKEAGDRYTAAKQVYDRLGPPRYLIGIVDAGHGAFTDVCGVIDTPELTDDGCSEGWRDPADVQTVTNRLAAPFFDHYLSGVSGAQGSFDEATLESEELRIEMFREL